MEKITLGNGLSWKPFTTALSQGILDGMRAASGHWLFRYPLILKKVSPWGHYCLITVCDYRHILQWPYSAGRSACSPENPCSWKFWLTRKYKWDFFFFFGLNWKPFLLKCHIFPPIWICLITVLALIYFFHKLCLEVCLDLSKCYFKAELWAEVFCHYLLFVGITGEIFLWSILCISTCSLGTMQDFVDTGGTLIPWLL